MAPHLHLQYHQKHVAALCFSPGRTHLASASRDATLALWELYPPGERASGAPAPR